jgi:hypothetical protein
LLIVGACIITKRRTFVPNTPKNYHTKPKIMKLTFRILSVFVFALLLASCSHGPEGVAEDFLNSLEKKDFAKAKELSTPESLQIIELVEKFSALDTSKAKGAEVKVSKCEVTGDKAVCTYCCNEEGKESTVNMKKIEDKWKVDMSKESLMGGQNMFDSLGPDSTGADMERDSTGGGMEGMESDTTGAATDSM